MKKEQLTISPKRNDQGLPEGWTIQKLGKLGKVSSGTTPLREKHREYFQGGAIPWVKTTDLNNSIILTSEECITERALKETSLRIHPPDTLLVAMYGGFNQIGRTGLLGTAATTNQALSAIECNSEITDPRYLLAWLNGNVEAWRNFAGSSRKDPNITSKDVRDFPVNLPPLPEQRKIATILTAWDEAIQTARQLLENKQLRKKALMQQVLTGQTRLPGFKDAWREVKLGEIFRERKDKGFDHLPLLAITSSNGVVMRDTLEKKDTSNSDKSKYLRICPNDIGYNTMRMWQGVSGVSRYEGLISPAYTVLVPGKSVDVGFMSYLFKFTPMIHTFWRFSQGLVSDTLNCKYDSLRRIQVSIPHLAEQRAIAEILNAADEEIRLATEEIEALQEQKRGLMQELLTGKKRVSI
ncbi:restriction endonuclease subunit S [Persicitalea jodogahamensis]|uniref:Type I restriction endonuclease subunit S n=1 Tax=Persicitalea jodogahamensis TaxID=402147 RepID=A0A8J3DFZ7_9BACT|nr:restriction endonuclease subunit S [Persicitalea jodogahamensis]GHB87834.1 type I restriction endonuclease subunit S [Persicitalea jodogahamensis]